MKRKNIVKKLFPVGLTVLALAMLGNFLLMLRDTKVFQNWKADFKDWQEEAVCVLGEKMTGMLAPVSAYLSEDHANSLLEWVLTYMKQTVPVQMYFSEMAIKNAEGKNPFEGENGYFLEIETMGLEQSTIENSEVTSEIPETEDFEAASGESELDHSEEEKESLEEESVKQTESETLSDDKEGDLSATGQDLSGEQQETVRQEGYLYFYQPAFVDSSKSEETQEVFLDGLIRSSGYSLEKLRDFDYLIQKFFAVRETTSIQSGELKVDELLSFDMKMKSGNESPQIFIYHSHSQEEFCDYVSGETGKQIVDVGTYLSELLCEEYGYYVVHDTTPYDMKNGVLDKSEAYTYAEEGIKAILQAYPSIEVVIDLHRDGVEEGVHLVTEVDGKQTAKLMFVNGISRTTWQGDISYLYNPYIKQNISFSFQLQLAASSPYPELIKRTMISAYRYNMHYREKSLLIEVGAQTNTTQEAMNAMEPLAKLLKEVLG